MDDAFDDVEALPSSATNEQIDELTDIALAKLNAMLALPARNVGDVLAKFNAAFTSQGELRAAVQVQALIEEFCNVVSVSLKAGEAFEQRGSEA